MRSLDQPTQRPLFCTYAPPVAVYVHLSLSNDEAHDYVVDRAVTHAAAAVVRPAVDDDRRVVGAN